MACYHPLDARKSPRGVIGFKPMTPFDKLIKLPCGRCIGCKIERSRQWAVRGQHEASQHRRSCSLLLTIRNVEKSDVQQPGTGPSLSMRDHQLFMKKLLRRLREYGPIEPIRFMMCGEYGEKNRRPHYHYVLFGYDFDDKYPYKKTKNGHQLYRSKLLEEIWPHGHADIGECNFEVIAYIARYVTKKITGEFREGTTCPCGRGCRTADEHYTEQLPDGSTVKLLPEFNAMSRNPGIGNEWAKKYSSSVYPHDRVVINGKPAKPPRYYDQQLEKSNAEMLKKVKEKREERATNSGDQSPERLRAGEQIAHARNDKKRSLE